jgi:hypothetical protein
MASETRSVRTLPQTAVKVRVGTMPVAVLLMFASPAVFEWMGSTTAFGVVVRNRTGNENLGSEPISFPLFGTHGGA